MPNHRSLKPLFVKSHRLQTIGLNYSMIGLPIGYWFICSYWLHWFDFETFAKLVTLWLIICIVRFLVTWACGGKKLALEKRLKHVLTDWLDLGARHICDHDHVNLHADVSQTSLWSSIYLSSFIKDLKSYMYMNLKTPLYIYARLYGMLIFSYELYFVWLFELRIDKSEKIWVYWEFRFYFLSLPTLVYMSHIKSQIELQLWT